MKGAPIQDATAAARAFLAERKKRPARWQSSPSARTSRPFSRTSPRTRPTRGGRRQDAGHGRGHAHLRRAHQGREQGEGPGTRANDGRTPVGRRERRKRRDPACRGPAGAERRQRPRHLGRSQVSPQYTPETLKTLAKRTNGSYIEADNPAALEQIYKEIGQQLSREFEITYRSLLPPLANAVVAREGCWTGARDGEVHDSRPELLAARNLRGRAGSTR